MSKRELGDGEPSPSPECPNCHLPLIRRSVNMASEMYCLGCDSRHDVAESGAAQEVSPPTTGTSSDPRTGYLKQEEVSPPSPRDQNLMRNRFEKWANAKGTMGDSWHGDHYDNVLHEAAWQAWQAAEITKLEEK